MVYYLYRDYRCQFEHPRLLIKLEPNSSYTRSQTQETGNNKVTATNYANHIEIATGPKESFLIKFDGNKCFTMTKTSENSLLNNDNYTAEKLGERTFKFTYTFTEADYNSATACR